MVLITVGGPPGSGTSTLCRLLMERTNLRYIYAGQLFRDQAMERGMTLMEFSTLCLEDPSIDRKLDDVMLEEARAGEAILEGRMIGPLCAKNAIASLKVYVDADPVERARRVMERDGGTLEDVVRTMEMREDLEKKRYVRYYGIDPTDTSWYDIVIDSTHHRPEQVLEIVMKKSLNRSC